MDQMACVEHDLFLSGLYSNSHNIIAFVLLQQQSVDPALVPLSEARVPASQQKNIFQVICQNRRHSFGSKRV